MLFSYNKLKQMVDSKIKLSRMIEIMNNLGFEVEDTIQMPVLQGVKYGKVLNISKHPNADMLFICEIEFEDKNRKIITNAINVEVGKFVMAFIPGSKMDGTTFDKKDLKGIESEGMLIGFEEIGFDSNLLPDSWKKGVHIFDEADLTEDPIKQLELNDSLIRVDILSNRSDANSYIIMAQEIKAYLNIGEYEKIKIKENLYIDNILMENSVKGNITMLLADNKKMNTTLNEKLLIIKSGLQVNCEFDNIANLTFLMTGQPIATYKKEAIKNNVSIVQGAGSLILNGEKREFTDNLMIKSNEEIISISGVAISDSCLPNEKDEEVIFEISNFDIKSVRKNAKDAKIDSLQTRQMSKKINAGTQEMALNFLVERGLVKNIYGKIEQIKQPIKFNKIKFMQLMGKNLSEKEYEELIRKMELLGFSTINNKFEVPAYRHDVKTQQDINEELIRLYGFEKIEPTAPKINSFKISEENSFSNEMVRMGYQETKTYTLISKEKNIINPFNFVETIELQTFISKERDTIRNSMAIPLLEIFSYNEKKKIDGISIFDIGQINKDKQVIGFCSNEKTFLEIKQDVISLLGDEVEFERWESPEIHGGTSAKIISNNKIVGWIGKLNPILKMPDALLGEIVIPQNKNIKIKVHNYSDEQLKTRDVTLSVGPKQDMNAYIKEIKRQSGIISIRVIDKYITKEETVKITVRVICDEEGSKILDEKFN